MSEEQNRFSLRKLSVGLASVLIGVSIFGTSQTVKADTVANNQTPSVTNNAQSSDTQRNENVVKSTFSNDNQANNVKNNLIQTQDKGKKDQKQDSALKTQETTDGSNLDAEKDIVRTSSLQESDNQSNHHVEDNSQTQTSQKLDLTKNSPKFAKKVLATNLIEINNKLTHSYTKQGSDPSVVKTPPKSLLASDNFDYSGTTTIQWNPKMTKGIADSIVSNIHVNPSDPSYEGAYSNSNIDGIVAIASTTLTGNNYIIDPKTGKQTRIAKMNRVFYDLKHAHTSNPLPLQVTIDTAPSSIPYNAYIFGGADQLSEYIEYFDDKNNKINIPLAYDTQIIGSLDGNSQNNERVSGVNGSVVYPYDENAMFLNNDPNTNTVAGNTKTASGQAIAIGGLTNGLTFSTTTDWGGVQWTMGLATPSQMQNLPYSEIDTRGISRNIHFVDEDGNQIQPTLTQTASWVSVKDKQGNIQTIGSQPNIAEYDIPHELTANGKTYLIDAFTDGNSSKLTSWTPANTDKNQDVYLVYKDLDVSVKYVDAVSGQTVKSDSFVSDPSQSVTYNYSVPDGYVLEAPAKTFTSYTFGDDKSDTPTITINLRKAIKRHYRVIENLPDGAQKVILDYNLTLPQRKNGTYGIPDFDETGNALSEDNSEIQKYDTLNKYFGGIPKMSSNNHVRINPDVAYPSNDYTNILFDIDHLQNTTPTFNEIRSNTINFTHYKGTPQFTYVVGATGITAEQNPSQDFFINYQHNTQNITDPSQIQSTGKRTITISMPQGHGDQMIIVQTVDFKRTGSLDLYTGKTTYTDWVFDADTSNVTVNGQVSTQYQAYVLKDGVVNYAPIKLPHINGYKVKLIQDKANPAMFMVSFMAVPTENKPSIPVEVAPSKPSANADNPNHSAWTNLDHKVVDVLNQSDSGWTMPENNSTYTVEVPADDATIDLSDLVIAQPVHAQTRTQIRVTKRFKLSKKHVAKHLKHRKKAVKSFKKYRL